MFFFACGLGASLAHPLLIGSFVDGLFPFAVFVGDVVGAILLLYAAITAYGLYRRVPFVG